jgi:hypothetical protein
MLPKLKRHFSHERRRVNEEFWKVPGECIRASQLLRSGLIVQSQRDCVLQPKVARHELPWENDANELNPNGVVARLADVHRRRNPVGVAIFAGRLPG